MYQHNSLLAQKMVLIPVHAATACDRTLLLCISFKYSKYLPKTRIYKCQASSDMLSSMNIFTFILFCKLGGSYKYAKVHRVVRALDTVNLLS